MTTATKGRQLTLHIDVDQFMGDPCEEDHNWKLVGFNRKLISFQDHDNITVGNLNFGMQGNPPTFHGAGAAGIRRKLEVGLAFVLAHYEHGPGTSTWMLNGGPYPAGVEFQWDGHEVAGILVWPHSPDDMGAKTPEKRREDAASFLKLYNGWANGNIYEFRLHDEHDEQIEGTSGWVDDDLGEAAEEVTSWLKPGDEVTVTGDSEWLQKYHDFTTIPVDTQE